MTGLRVVPLARAQDFREALAAAGLQIEMPHDALQDAAHEASNAAWRVVVAQCSPSLPDLHAAANALGQLETAFAHALECLTRGLQRPMSPELDSRAGLSRQIAAVNDPFHLNLLGAIQANPDVEDPARAWAEMIMLVEQWVGYARTAQQAVDSGAQRERKTRLGPEERSPARELGLVLIRVYARLTGQPLRMSRCPTGPCKGQLTGPLIRFLHAMFARVRAAVAAHPQIANLAADKDWAPSGETLREWIGRVRKDMAEAGSGVPSQR